MSLIEIQPQWGMLLTQVTVYFTILIWKSPSVVVGKTVRLIMFGNWAIFVFFLQTLHPDVSSIILDILNVIDAVTSQTDADDSKDRQLFCAIVKECEKVVLISIPNVNP